MTPAERPDTTTKAAPPRAGASCPFCGQALPGSEPAAACPGCGRGPAARQWREDFDPDALEPLRAAALALAWTPPVGLVVGAAVTLAAAASQSQVLVALGLAVLGLIGLMYFAGTYSFVSAACKAGQYRVNHVGTALLGLLPVVLILYAIPKGLIAVAAGAALMAVVILTAWTLRHARRLAVLADRRVLATLARSGALAGTGAVVLLMLWVAALIALAEMGQVALYQQVTRLVWVIALIGLATVASAILNVVAMFRTARWLSAVRRVLEDGETARGR